MRFIQSLNVGAILLLLMIIYYLRTRYGIASKRNRYFYNFILWLLVETVSDTVFTTLLMLGVGLPVWLYLLIGAWCQICLVVYPLMLVRYIRVSISGENRLPWMEHIVRGVLLSYLASVIVGSFFGWYIVINPDLTYSRGPIFVVPFLIAGLLLLNSSTMVLLNKDDYSKRQKISVILNMLVFWMAWGTQILWLHNVRLIYFFATLCALSILFEIETPDYLKLQQTMNDLERSRAHADKLREEAEAARAEEQKMREEAEEAKSLAELERVTAEAARALAEESRNEAEKARETALMASKAKSTFLANMSHEIRTPINGVLGMNEILLKELTDPQQIEYAENIQKAGKSLLSIINDTLDLSKIESGNMELLPVEYELSKMIEDCVNLVEQRAKDKGLEFELNVDNTLPRLLYGDEVRVRQIITNLLTNAVKYTKMGTVTLTVTWRDLGMGKMELKVFVKDTGIGISAENREMLFRAFQRVDEINTRNIEGTGLGLQITSQLVELMNGTIELDSAYGVGSEFRVMIPQRVIGEESIGKITHSATEKSAGEKAFTAPDALILAVDDVSVNLKVLQGLLKQTQVQIDTADRGSLALTMAAQKKYDLILMDHMMPGMDGVETMRRMGQMKESLNKDTPVIVLTANAVSGAREEYIRDGFVDYLTKPLKGEDLIACLKKYLGGSSTDQEIEGDSALTAGAEEGWMARVGELLDTERGLMYCAEDQDLYRQVLVGFILENQIEVLESMFAQEDWNGYRIRVHGVKSTALTIGAEDLSEEARELELAIKDDRLYYVIESHAKFMAHYRDFLRKLEKALDD